MFVILINYHIKQKISSIEKILFSCQNFRISCSVIVFNFNKNKAILQIKTGAIDINKDNNCKLLFTIIRSDRFL